MIKRSKAATVAYKTFIGLLSLAAFIAAIANLGVNAWRFFSTFLLILTFSYFLACAGAFLFSSKRKLGQNPCPMLEGMLIVSYLVQVGTVLMCQDATLPSYPPIIRSAIYFVVPVLIIIDQILFNRKGTWRIAYPIYWLALPVTYGAWVVVSANFLVHSVPPYTLPFLDVAKVGFYDFLTWGILFALIIGVISYLLFFIDFVISGHLAKRVVLPHIRVVELSDQELK